MLEVGDLTIKAKKKWGNEFEKKKSGIKSAQLNKKLNRQVYVGGEMGPRRY